MKKNKSTLILTLVFVVGVCIMAYPTVSNWWNNRVSTHQIDTYKQLVESIDDTDYEALFDQARAYNSDLKKMTYPLSQYKSVSGYTESLNVSGDGMMGYISIPKISVDLPIYHTVDDKVLDTAVGHLEGSSLPTGDVGSHVVLSAHRGLPRAKLFTDLDTLIEGDIFVLTILNQTFTYKVDQIRIVEPEDTSLLDIDPDKDYCTLLTCTPYGVNTQRLLVRGIRTDNLSSVINITDEAYEMDSLFMTPFAAIPILIVLALVMYFQNKKRKQKKAALHADEKGNGL